jgi:hypothetical protein
VRRRAQVVALGLDAGEASGLRGALQLRTDLGREPEVVVAEGASRLRGARLAFEPPGGDLANRDEHGEQGHAVLVVLAHEAAVDELEQRAEQVLGPRLAARHGLDGVEAEVAAKTPSRAKSRCASSLSRSRLQATVASIVRCRSGMSRAPVTSSGSTDRAARASPTGGEGPDAGGGELDRERDAPRAHDRCGRCLGVFGRELEARIRRSGSVDEQADRRRVLIASNDARVGSGGTTSGATSNTRSPRTRSRARLVTRNDASGRSLRSCTSSGAAPSTCSKLSSTMRVAAAGAGDAELFAQRPVGGVAHAELARESPAPRRPVRAGAPATRRSRGSKRLARAARHSIASRLLADAARIRRA